MTGKGLQMTNKTMIEQGSFTKNNKVEIQTKTLIYFEIIKY